MFKKVLSVMLVLLMVFALCGTAFAEEAKKENGGKGKVDPWERYVWMTDQGWIIVTKPHYITVNGQQIEVTHTWDEYLSEVHWSGLETLYGVRCFVFRGYAKPVSPNIAVK